MKTLQDSDPFPFGKYGPKPRGEGLTMEGVPASYFNWLWTEGGLKNDKTSDVADYIRRNMSALQAEHPDLIW